MHLFPPSHCCLQPYEEPDEGDETEEVEEEEEEEDKAPRDGYEDILRSQGGYESGYNTGMAASQTGGCRWLADRQRPLTVWMQNGVAAIMSSFWINPRICMLADVSWRAEAACLPAGAETEGVLSGGETDAEDMFESGSEALSLLQDLGSPQQATLDPAEQGVQPFEVLRSRRRRLQAEVETDTDWQGTGAEGDQEDEGAAQQVGRDG